MGCDIHLYKEKFIGGKWVSADQWVAYDYGDDEKGVEVPFEKRFTDRNYNLFGLLSKGVRREHEFSFEQRGFPLTASPEVVASHDGWAGDAHSESYLFLHELKELLGFVQSKTVQISGMKDREGLAELDASIASGDPDYNLLYPYCQATNAPNAVDFVRDIPASFITGDGLEKIIASFEGVDGENHRIVFWFDN